MTTPPRNSSPYEALHGFERDSSDLNLLDVVQSDLVPGAVIELGRSRTGVGSHLLRLFQRAFAFQVAGDARRPEAMAAGLGAYVRLLDPSADVLSLSRMLLLGFGRGSHSLFEGI